MTLTYSLSRSDYLAWLFFRASRSQLMKRRKIFSWIFVPAMCAAVVAVNLALIRRIWDIALFAGVAAAWTAVFPFYWKWAIKRGYSKQIDEHYKNVLGAEERLESDGAVLRSTGKGVTSEIALTEIDVITEIMTHVFIALKSGSALILPKDKIETGLLTGFVNRLAEQSGKEVVKRTDWKA